MASSGSFNTSAYKASDGTRFLTFSWEETNQSVGSNTTTISCLRIITQVWWRERFLYVSEVCGIPK